MISLIKSKLTAIGAGLIGILAVAASFLYALLQREKRERADQELEDEKVATKYANNATEALIRGMEDESTKESNNRKYKFGD